VDQTIVARWETGKYHPTTDAFIKIARYVPDEEEKPLWYEYAGLTREDIAWVRRSDDENVVVPQLTDAVSAGPGRVIEEDIEKYLSLPAEWVPRGGKVRALRVIGDSMAPIIQRNFIVLIDAAQRDPKSLEDKMVVAREADELKIKWLRKEGKFYQLVPEHPTERNRVRILTADKDVAIIGRVIKWIGSPEPEK